jgi:hypothetical protein
MEIPQISPYRVDEAFIRSQKQLLAFDKMSSRESTDRIVHFYVDDYKFTRISTNPEKYAERLKPFRYVITPDFSQQLGMLKFQCFYNSCLNKAIAAFWQSLGVNIIFNVSWSTPDSFSYAFTGVPKGMAISISSIGVKSLAISKYTWQCGYDTAIKTLEPSLILRFGERMLHEEEDKSVYFDNPNFTRTFYGS